MTHNFVRLSTEEWKTPDTVLLGGKEGLMLFRHGKSQWEATAPVMAGEPPVGVGEVRLGFADRIPFITTVEPMHGNILAVYHSQKGTSLDDPLERRVLTDKLAEGHALACGSILGNPHSQEIVVGWRGKIGTTDTSIGLAVWTPMDAKGEMWRESAIDPDNMACEDLQLADLDGDGRLDIIASGRRTHNVKIYFNDTVAPKP